MKSRLILSTALIVPLAAVFVGGVAGGWSSSNDPPIPFDDAMLFFEFNATDEDFGIQFFLDGEAWKEVKITKPGGGKLVELKASGNLKQIGLTELFSESDEPSLDELPLEEFLAMFPEGVYKFSGKTVEGDKLTGTATLSHDIPAAPVILSPVEGEVTDPDNTVIVWMADPAVASYQVVVEHEASGVDMIVNLPASTTTLHVPEEFLEPDDEYKVEVLAILANGNKTITEVPFTTAP